MAMKHTVEMLKVRRNKLVQKDPVVNKNLVNKLDRKIRKLESAN